LFLKLWKILMRMRIDKKVLINPFKYFIKTIYSDTMLNNSRAISKKKFFPLITPKKFQNEIVNLIGTLKS